MVFFDSLLGGSKKTNAVANPKLNLEYNVMKNIALEKFKKYEKENHFERIENGIYKALNEKDEASYRMTMSYELEFDSTNNQYPLEDILDKYYLHVSDFLENENSSKPNTFKTELCGELNDEKK